MSGGIRPKRDFNKHQEDMVKVGLQETLDTNTQNLKGCGKEAKGKYRGQEYTYICDKFHLCEKCNKHHDGFTIEDRKGCGKGYFDEEIGVVAVCNKYGLCDDCKVKE